MRCAYADALKSAWHFWTFDAFLAILSADFTRKISFLLSTAWTSQPTSIPFQLQNKWTFWHFASSCFHNMIIKMIFRFALIFVLHYISTHLFKLFTCIVSAFFLSSLSKTVTFHQNSRPALPSFQSAMRLRSRNSMSNFLTIQTSLFKICMQISKIRLVSCGICKKKNKNNLNAHYSISSVQNLIASAVMKILWHASSIYKIALTTYIVIICHESAPATREKFFIKLNKQKLGAKSRYELMARPKLKFGLIINIMTKRSGSWFLCN